MTIPCETCKTPTGCRLSNTCRAPQAATAPHNPILAAAVQGALSDVAKVEADTRPVQDAGAAQEAPVAPTEEQQKAAAKWLAESRLCIKCKHLRKAITQPVLLSNCAHPSYPVNLINGERLFPCLISRGYEDLCGTMGKLWEYNGK